MASARPETMAPLHSWRCHLMFAMNNYNDLNVKMLIGKSFMSEIHLMAFCLPIILLIVIFIDTRLRVRAFEQQFIQSETVHHNYLVQDQFLRHQLSARWWNEESWPLSFSSFHSARCSWNLWSPSFSEEICVVDSLFLISCSHALLWYALMKMKVINYLWLILIKYIIVNLKCVRRKLSIGC